MTEVMTHRLFSKNDGRWEGKSFGPLCDEGGEGVNRFERGEDRRRFRVRFEKAEVVLDYKADNGGWVGGMRDYLRVVSVESGKGGGGGDVVLLGLGTLKIGGGRWNPAPFVLVSTGRAVEAS